MIPMAFRRFKMNNIHESRLMALRYHVPPEVSFMLIGVAIIAMAFTGYQAGARAMRGRVATLMMSLMLTGVIMLILDVDRPTRGGVNVSVEPLADAAHGLPP
jgi:hypothetical protein